MDSFIIATVFGLYAFAGFVFYSVNGFAKEYLKDRELMWAYLHIKMDRISCSVDCKVREPVKLGEYLEDKDDGT